MNTFSPIAGDVVKLWRNDFGISLPSNGLLGEEFCAKWMREGKMRKMIKLWCTVDANIAEMMPVYELTVCFLSLFVSFFS